MAANKIYGIDLGTTYSCISVVDEHGQPKIINNSENEATTPSVVYFENENNIVVGNAAKDVSNLYPDSVVSTVKRAMGDPEWKLEFFGETYTPQSISALILSKVVNDARQITGDEIKDVVITCPAYFSAKQKEATKQAGEIAGLNVKYVIPEPVAAAIAYGVQSDKDECILVYDLGGGTFDSTVIQISGGHIDVKVIRGNHELGGKNWDEQLVEFFVKQFTEETGKSEEELTGDPEIIQEFFGLAETCKVRLTSSETWTKRLNALGESIKVEVTRDKFNELTSALLEQTINYVEDTLEGARNKGIENVDRIILVGGSSYMLQVMDRLKEKYTYEVSLFQPNQAVAMGAAIFGLKCSLEDAIQYRIEQGESREEAEKEVNQESGFTLGGNKLISEIEVTNAVSKSIGIVVVDNSGQQVVDNLIQIDDPVPWQGSQTYPVYDDNASSINIQIMENQKVVSGNESVSLDECTSELKKAELVVPQELHKGDPIEVSFNLSSDGIFHLTARDPKSGATLELTAESEGLLSAKEIEEARMSNLQKNIS